MENFSEEEFEKDLDEELDESDERLDALEKLAEKLDKLAKKLEGSDESGEESDEEFVKKLGRFYGTTDVLNSIIRLDIKPCDNHLTFAVEAAELPYTIVYAPASDTVINVARQIDGLQIDEEAEAFILIFRRTVLGNSDSDIRGVAMIHGEDLNCRSAELSLDNIIIPFLQFAVNLNSFLNSNPDVYSAYQSLDRKTSGIILGADDGTIKTETVTGKDRPDMACRDTLNLGYLFASEPPIVTARPYSDEIGKQLMMDGMSLEEKIEAAENGDEEMMEFLAHAYLSGDEDGIRRNFKKSFYWWQKLADSGSALGQFNLGLHYVKGCGIKRDLDEAAKWMEKAAESGDEDAPNAMQLYREAVENLKKAKAGDAAAQATMARFYTNIAGTLNEYGSKEDYKEAFKWAQKSADQGHEDGLYTLALAYHRGRGVEVNMDTAIDYYKKGAELEYPPCVHNLGSVYMSGEGIRKNTKKGLGLIKAAAEKGYAPAMKDLGLCYQLGNGCEEDLNTALEWYEKAFELHDAYVDNSELEMRIGLLRAILGLDDDDQDLDEDNDD